ncbi:MAG TPA: adenylate cyclase [Actinomycetota bacterium]|nr:adenylate cyclase [Actinomycetota bacterium]
MPRTTTQPRTAAKTQAAQPKAARKPAKAAKRPSRLTDEQLAGMLALTSHADSVELKLTVPDAERRSIVAALGMDPLDAQIRQVFFFDTPDLRLNQAGVVVRARRVQGRGDDTVVKLRPIVPDDLPPSVRNAKTMVVEVDAMPGGYVCSASFKGSLGPGDAVKQVAAGDRAIRKLYSKGQRAFYAAHAPDGLDLNDLTVLGPINVLKLKFTPKGFNRRMVAELWLYPDGERILELSTKCAPSEGFQVGTEARAFLAERGVDLFGEQHTKTKTALEFFSRSLEKGA